VPLTAAVVVDNGDPGPSVGDEIEWTATVDPTGQCGCAALRFSAAIPGNAAAVPDSVTTTRGTVLDEDPVSVHIGHLPADAADVTITWRVIPSSGGSVESQASLDCAQIPAGVLSDNPATGADDDATAISLAPGSYFTVTPCRVLDTRQSSALADGVPLDAAVHGVCGVAATATAVALNVTVTQPTGSGDVTVHRADEASPLTPFIHFSGGQTRANNGIAAVSPSGEIRLLADVAGGGTVHAIVDVVGYFQ
jgi:hypothetical protein